MPLIFLDLGAEKLLGIWQNAREIISYFHLSPFDYPH